MPAVALAGAVALLASLGRTQAGGLIRKALPLALAGTAGAVGIPGVDLFNGNGDKVRRRRRRALTVSDKNDIAFVAAAVGEPTARKFALLIAARSN
ncbi:MAG TPA: hypothetical protein EYO33_24200 [Phycisphaerales bacterium]|jgi:hypothetical protein|nr:hypothetical protein [Phycisphaerales bacterium]